MHEYSIQSVKGYDSGTPNWRVGWNTQWLSEQSILWFVIVINPLPAEFETKLERYKH